MQAWLAGLANVVLKYTHTCCRLPAPAVSEYSNANVWVAPDPELGLTETDDGGADSSSGPVEVAIEDPIAYEAEIVNTFVAAETTTTAAAAAEAVEAVAAFTG